MATPDPAVYLHTPSGHVATVKVEGVAFRLPGDTDAQVADLVRHFQPATVPILARHYGRVIGYLDSLRADGFAVRFTGTINADIVARLPSPVSIEMSEGFAGPAGRPSLSAASLRAMHPGFRGTLHVGMNLVGFALVTRPKAPGSKIWKTEGDPTWLRSIYPGILQTTQTGNGDSTNVMQRSGGDANGRMPVLRIVSTVGATPTVTINIKGSGDGVTWWNIPYSPLASPAGEWSTAPLTITTAATALHGLMPQQSWTFLKLVMSANTNVTLTSDVL